MTITSGALALAALGPLFAAWPGVASPYVLPKLFFLALAAAAASLGTAFAKPSAPSKGPAKPDILRPLAACLGAAALATLFSQDRAASVLGEYSARTQGLLTLGLCAVVAALAQSAGAAFARAALLAGAAAGALMSAHGLIQYAGYDPVVDAIGSLPYGRIGSLVGSPVGLGCALAMLAPLQLRLALDGEDAPRRLLGWAFLGLSSLALVLTWSRGAWLAAALASGCYLLWTGRLRLPKMPVLAAAALVAGALAVAAVRARPTATSDMGRVAVWLSSLKVFAAHPVLGAGPDTVALMLGRHKTEGFVRAYGELGGQGHAHNDLLQALATTGLPGLAAYIWLLLAAWRRLKNALRDETLRAGAAAAGAGLVAAFVVAKFNPVPLDALALAAALLGLLDPGGTRPRALPKAASALTAAAVFASAWLLLADRRAYQGMRAQHEGRLDDARAGYAAAARLQPAEARYGFWLVGLLREQARLAPQPAERLALGADAAAAARAMERWNPRDVRALHALGGSLAALSLQGGPDAMAEAAAALDRGARADWSYRPLLETRLTVATLRKDARAKADTQARIARLDALKRQNN
ncbi:MAG: O-antigen ligase family protein [Elusimicrobiota bacterium]|nr:O-antigen ligase family protein [Elusimicrobiota bacterium]